jgi:hypothetical protein
MQLSNSTGTRASQIKQICHHGMDNQPETQPESCFQIVSAILSNPELGTEFQQFGCGETGEAYARGEYEGSGSHSLSNVILTTVTFQDRTSIMAEERFQGFLGRMGKRDMRALIADADASQCKPHPLTARLPGLHEQHEHTRSSNVLSSYVMHTSQCGRPTSETWQQGV